MNKSAFNMFHSIQNNPRVIGMTPFKMTTEVLLVPTLSVGAGKMAQWFRTLFALVEAGFNSLQPRGGSQPL